jgi:peptidyl-prolyl cis-trans isomerase D
MLQWIRDRFQGAIVWLLTFGIILVFVLGAGSYLFRQSNNSKTIAKVENQVITAEMINSSYNNYVRQNYSGNKSYDSFDLDPKKIKDKLANDLINKTAITKGLINYGFLVTSEDLLNYVKNDPFFQEKGVFSSAKYTNFLKQSQINEWQFQDLLKDMLLVEQCKNSILLSNFVHTNNAEDFIKKWYQVRNFGYVIVPAKRFNQSTISDQAIEDYYQQHKTSFVTPETVSIAYLDVSLEQLRSKVKVNNEALKNYYQEHQEYYTLPELVHIRHILITDPNKSDESRVKIEDILAKLKLGEDFQELAKKYSEDLDSAVNGGDLKWLGKGEIDDENFEQAAFNLAKEGDISEVVESKFGYHIIQLINKRAAKVGEFDKVIEQVTNHYKEEESQNKLDHLVEQLSRDDIIKEDLSKLANKFELQIQFAGPFTSHGAKDGIGSYSEVVAAAFDEQKFNHNSDLIRLSEDRMVVVKAIKKHAAYQKTLLEAHDEVKATLQQLAAKNLVKEYSLNLSKDLLSSTTPSKLVKSHELDWKLVTAKRDDANVDPKILKLAFSLSLLNKQQMFSLENGDHVIVQLSSIADADLEKMLSKQPDLIKNVQKQLGYGQAMVEHKLFEQELIKNVKIKKFITNSEQW